MSCRRAQVGNALKDHNRWHNRRAARAKPRACHLGMETWATSWLTRRRMWTGRRRHCPELSLSEPRQYWCFWWVVGALMA